MSRLDKMQIPKNSPEEVYNAFMLDGLDEWEKRRKERKQKMIYTNTRLEELRDIRDKIDNLMRRIETNRDNAEDKFLIRFFCETSPVDPLSPGGIKREEKEIIELYQDFTTKRARDEIIKGLGTTFRGIK